MAVYCTWMVKVLDQEDRNWRENTVWLLDGASMHTSEATQQHLAWLKVPVIYSAPYSYVSQILIHNFIVDNCKIAKTH